MLDACAVLSLYATRRMAEIIAVIPGPVAVCDVVIQEALFIRHLIDAELVRESVDLSPMVGSGVLAVINTDDEVELRTFVQLSVDLDDGEAMTAALAIHRSYILVTDDRKAERLLAERVQLRSTLDLVKTWADAEQIDDNTLRDMLQRIDERGYIPPNGHPLKAWWDHLSDRDRYTIVE